MKNFSSLKEALEYRANCPACGEKLINQKVDDLFLGKDLLNKNLSLPHVPNNVILYTAHLENGQVKASPDFNHYCLIDLDGSFELIKSINSDYPINSLWGFRNKFSLINTCKKCCYYENSIVFSLNFTTKKVEEVILSCERVHYFIDKDPIIDYCINQYHEENLTEIKYKLGQSLSGYYKTIKLNISDLDFSNPDKLSNKIANIIMLM